MIAFGGENGILECYDPRGRRSVAHVNVGADVMSRSFSNTDSAGITALKFRDDGLSLAVGAETGQVLVYDIRGRSPVAVKGYNYYM